MFKLNAEQIEAEAVKTMATLLRMGLTDIAEGHEDYRKCVLRCEDRIRLVQLQAEQKPFSRVYNEIGMEIVHAEADLAAWGVAP